MRQFIHDDKGTVCIGTFGLRGSATDDNSASGTLLSTTTNFSPLMLDISSPIDVDQYNNPCNMKCDTHYNHHTCCHDSTFLTLFCATYLPSFQPSRLPGGSFCVCTRSVSVPVWVSPLVRRSADWLGRPPVMSMPSWGQGITNTFMLCIHIS